MKTFFFFIHALAQSNAIQFRADEPLPLEQQTSPDYTTYVLILIGIIFVGYFIVTKRRMFEFIFRAATGKFNVTSNNPLSIDKQRSILLGAVYSSQQHARLDTLKLHIESNRRNIILKEWWGIQNTDDALETLDRLRDVGHRYFFPPVVEAMKQAGDQAKKDILLAHFKTSEEMERAILFLNNLQEALETMKKEGTITDMEDLARIGVAGWDVARLSFITRACYDAGYIDEETAWSYLQAADQLAHATLGSWKALGDSYVVGRYFWGGVDEASSLIHLYAKELSEKLQSPWKRIAFKTV